LNREPKFIFFLLPKQSVLLLPREDFGLFFTLVGHLHETLCVRHLYRKFEEEGSVNEEKQPWAPAVRSPENVEALRVAMQRSPGKSTRKPSRELGISLLSIQRILHSDPKLFPYKISVA
jgi:hypothetical protein